MWCGRESPLQSIDNWRKSQYQNYCQTESLETRIELVLGPAVSACVEVATGAGLAITPPCLVPEQGFSQCDCRCSGRWSYVSERVSIQKRIKVIDLRRANSFERAEGYDCGWCCCYLRMDCCGQFESGNVDSSSNYTNADQGANLTVSYSSSPT